MLSARAVKAVVSREEDILNVVRELPCSSYPEIIFLSPKRFKVEAVLFLLKIRLSESVFEHKGTYIVISLELLPTG
jgi:hypothetical protein